MRLERHLLLKNSHDTPWQYIKKQRHHFANKGPYSQSYDFPVLVYGCESWTIKKTELKNWCFWTVVLEKTLESPLDCKEIKPVHPRGRQLRIFIWRTDIEAEAPVLWPPDTKNKLEKNLMLGKIEARGEGGNRGWDGWMASLTQWTWVSKLREIVKDREAWCAAVHRVTQSQTWHGD